MATYRAATGVQTLTGTMGDDHFIFNFDQVDSAGMPSPEHEIDAGDIVDGGDGYDALWAGQTMDMGYSEDFDFRPVTFVSIEELNFNWMKMPMPGDLQFNSSQFGTGLSNNLVVKGAWDDCSITVHLDTADFDASGWTFPSPATTTVGGVPAGGSFYSWGPYIYQGTGIYNNMQIGVGALGDRIYLVGSNAANDIVGSIVDDIITGGDGADTLKGIGGNDNLDGGVGSDTAIFTGNRSDYTVTETGGVFTLVDNRAGMDGTDTVTGVEDFQFADMTLGAADVVAGTPGDTTPPAAPTIVSTTDGPPAGNPSWIVNGMAEANSTVNIYTSDGMMVGTGMADAAGAYAIETATDQHGPNVFYAKAVDAAGNVSDASLLYYQGGHHTDMIDLANPAALAAYSKIDGYEDVDTLHFTSAATITDGDFAKVTGVETLALTGASTVTLGAQAAATGISSVMTGDGNTTITDSNMHALMVDGAMLANGTTLSLSGAADFTATGSDAGVKINASNSTGTNMLTGGMGADTLWGGSGANMIHGGDGSDAIWLAFGAAGPVASAMLYGDAGNDHFYVNRQSYLSENVMIDGGAGHDALWAGKGMANYEENFDFSEVTFTSIEALHFNYMPMEMPGQAIFSSDQFGAGKISEMLEVRGAYGDNDITVNLVDGDSSFNASGWTFPTGAGTSMPTAYAWGPYTAPVTVGMVTAGQEVGGIDTIHLNGSDGANTIVGSIVADMISGGGGDDILTGAGGDDSIDGGAGAGDTAVFSGNYADYTVTASGAGFQVVGADGTDMVTNVENLQFADQTVATSTLGDTTAPAAPMIVDWDDTTAPVLMNGANPLWRISGTAEPGAIIKLFNTTLNADGSVNTRTQIATYTQGAPNPTTGAPTVVMGPDFVVADASGNWVFQSNLNEHGDRRVSASATDASGNISDFSLVYIQGSHHSTTNTFTNVGALAGISVLDGFHQDTGNGDTLSFTDANVTMTDADFAKIRDMETLQFAGASTVTLGANALAAGIGGLVDSGVGSYGKIITGTGNTTITDSNEHMLTVDGAALGAGTTLSLNGAADFVATGSNAGVMINASNTTGDNMLTGGTGNDTLWGGSGANMIHGGDGSDQIWLAFGAAGPVASAMLYGDAGNDHFYVNRQSYLSENVMIDGGEGHDALWAGKGMSNYEENFDFSEVTFASIEALHFNYMPMEMPGQAIFSSDQFGEGKISDMLEVRGAWGDNDITVNLVGGDSTFDASGWTFPHGNGVMMGAYAWGPWTSTVDNMHVDPGQEVGGIDTIHLNGSDGVNTIIGTIVDDIITGAGGNDTINGGDGVDVAMYSGSRADYYITMDEIGNYHVMDIRGAAPDGTDMLVDVENVRFSDGTYALSPMTGGAEDNMFDAQIGVIEHFDGGAGSDTVSYAAATAGVQVDLNNQWSWDGTTMDFFTSIENATGGSGDDNLTGDSNDNVLNGGAGVDHISGGDGSDTAFYAGSTAGVQVDLVNQWSWDGTSMDFLNSIENATGGSGADALYGDGAANRLDGGAGADSLWGYGGADTFVFSSPSDGVDTIGDMMAGSDMIELGAGFTGLSSTGGVLDAASFVIGGSATGALAQIIYDNVSGSLSYDADGTGAGAAVQFANLNAGLALTNTDFSVASAPMA